MRDLILAMFMSASVSAVMRTGSGGDQPRKPMLAINYLVCFLVSLSFIDRDAGTSGMGTAVSFGLIGGILYLGAFLLFQKSVFENGITLSSAFMKLGVIVPVVLGFTLFGERVSLAGAVGILLTLAAILVLSYGPNPGSVRQKGAGILVLLLLCGGMADCMSKFFNVYGNAAFEGHFLCYIFGFALLLSSALCAFLRQKPLLHDLLFGILLGLPNYFSSRFLLLSLNTVPASIAYPVFSCGTIILTSLAGRFIFREKMDPRQYAALLIVLAALVLLNR